MKRVLLDANVLIRALNHGRNTTQQEHTEAKQILSESLQDENIGAVLTPLVRHEVMRGISRADLSKTARIKNILDQFLTIEINNEIEEVATTIFQILSEQRSDDSASTRNIKRLGFDIMHVATAHVYDLELISSDSDITSLLSLIKDHPSDFRKTG